MQKLKEKVETTLQVDMPFLQYYGLRKRKDKDKVYDPFQLMKIAADVVAKLRDRKKRR